MDGYRITYISVDKKGRIDLNLIEDAIEEDTFLLTILHGNNEIGNIYPIKDISDICKKNNVFIHVDGAQTVGKLDIDLNNTNIDFLSFSSHKIYGPKGMGALYINNQSPIFSIEPIIHGGGQELGIRAGTLAVQNIVGFGKACEICQNQMIDDDKEIKKIRDYLLSNLQSHIPNIKINGDLENRLSGNLNVTFPDINNTSLMMSLKDIALSNGSACTSRLTDMSHVLKAIGLSKESANSSVRFGIGRFNTMEEIQHTTNKIIQTLQVIK